MWLHLEWIRHIYDSISAVPCDVWMKAHEGRWGGEPVPLQYTVNTISNMADIGSTDAKLSNKDSNKDLG